MKDFFLNFAIDVIIGLKNLFLLSRVPVSENSETTERDYSLAPGAASAQSLVSRHGGKIPALAASLHHTSHLTLQPGPQRSEFLPGSKADSERG